MPAVGTDGHPVGEVQVVAVFEAELCFLQFAFLSAVAQIDVC